MPRPDAESEESKRPEESEESGSIFQKEETILHDATAAFRESEQAMETLLSNFSSITKSYKRLLRQVKQLTRVSDGQQRKLLNTQKALDVALKKSDELLLNILPEETAEELKETGKAKPRKYSASVLFTDFKGFTMIAEQMTIDVLINTLGSCFDAFDSIVEQYKLEKIKTIGDSYMCAGGLPAPNTSHPVDAVLTGLGMTAYIQKEYERHKKQNKPYWEIRIGVHTGELVAGVIGSKKFAYDVWGDTVNTASRMESSGVPGHVNISADTYALVKEFFACESRGLVKAKNKGELQMYQVNGILPELSKRKTGKEPNQKFWDLYKKKFESEK